MTEPPVSFAPADQRGRVCPQCERTFRSSDTRQKYCNLACSSRAQANKRYRSSEGESRGNDASG